MARLVLDGDLTKGSVDNTWSTEKGQEPLLREIPLLIEEWPLNTTDRSPDKERRIILDQLFEKRLSIKVCLQFQSLAEAQGHGAMGVLKLLLEGGKLSPGCAKNAWPSDPTLQKTLKELPSTLLKLAAKR